MKFASLSDLLGLGDDIREILRYFSRIADAETVRDRVVATYDLAVRISELTPTPADDAVVRFFNADKDRFDLLIDLVVECLDLVGYEDGPVPEPMRAKAAKAGVNEYLLHIVVQLFKRAMDAAPHVLEFIDSIYPNFIRGGTMPEPPPEVPKAKESVVTHIDGDQNP